MQGSLENKGATNDLPTPKSTKISVHENNFILIVLKIPKSYRWTKSTGGQDIEKTELNYELE